MADPRKEADSNEGTAGARDKKTDKPTDHSGQTGAGQEAARGKAPEQHDREHQSNYGGGGVNGGTNDRANKS